MADRKVIAVMGATGAQGGGLLRAILADPAGGFAARAVTSNARSDKARGLAAAGAEVVQADVYDAKSLERAFAGAHGIFCVSFFWASMSVQKEQQEIRNMAAAARLARPQHVIWSTLEDVRDSIPVTDTRMPTLQGNYKVPHFDGKAEMDHLFAELPTTYLYASFYWENFIYFGQGPKPGPDGTLTLALPLGTEKMAGVASEDIGKVAYGIFKRGPAELAGQRIGVAGDQLTGDEMAAAFAKHLGRPVRYQAIEPNTYRGFGFPGADEMGNMYEYYRDFADLLNQRRDVARSRSFDAELQNFDTWLAAHKNMIPTS